MKVYTKNLLLLSSKILFEEIRVQILYLKENIGTYFQILFISQACIKSFRCFYTAFFIENFELLESTYEKEPCNLNLNQFSDFKSRFVVWGEESGKLRLNLSRLGEESQDYFGLRVSLSSVLKLSSERSYVNWSYMIWRLY